MSHGLQHMSELAAERARVDAPSLQAIKARDSTAVHGQLPMPVLDDDFIVSLDEGQQQALAAYLVALQPVPGERLEYVAAAAAGGAQAGGALGVFSGSLMHKAETPLLVRDAQDRTRVHPPAFARRGFMYLGGYGAAGAVLGAGGNAAAAAVAEADMGPMRANVTARALGLHPVPADHTRLWAGYAIWADTHLPAGDERARFMDGAMELSRAFADPRLEPWDFSAVQAQHTL